MEFRWPNEERPHPACPDSRPIIRPRARPLFPPLEREVEEEQQRRIQKEAQAQQHPSDPCRPLKEHEVRCLQRYTQLRFLRQEPQGASARGIPFLLGRSVWSHEVLSTNLARLTPLLVLGAAATGKTQLVKCALRALAGISSADTTRFVVMTPGNRLLGFEYAELVESRHLAVPPAFTDGQVVEVLWWIADEARMRRKLFEGSPLTKDRPDGYRLQVGRFGTLSPIIVVVDGLEAIGTVLKEPEIKLLLNQAPHVNIHFIFTTRSIRHISCPALVHNINRTVCFWMPDEVLPGNMLLSSFPGNAAQPLDFGFPAIARCGEFLFLDANNSLVRGWGAHE